MSSDSRERAIQLVPITAACPTCGSADVVYSCKPECCFNHVCGACRTSFQLGTRLLPDEMPPVEDAPEDYDTSFPTARCAACGDFRVFQIEGRDALYCAQCRSVLQLEYTEIQAYSK